MTPDEIMDKLEKRVGPQGRKLFEQFLRKVNKLQVQQQLEEQAQMGITERSRGRKVASCSSSSSRFAFATHFLAGRLAEANT
jgi:hypothetical protein